MKIINMPSFGADMAKGEVAEWKVKPGDEVKKGDIIATIETMKGLIDLEVFDDGVIHDLLVQTGVEIEVGEPIAELQMAGESTMAEPHVNQAHAKANSTDADKRAVTKEHAHHIPNPITKTHAPHNSQANANLTEPKISPAARAKAQELGIDWRKLQSSRSQDRPILLVDILAVAASPSASQLPSQSLQSTSETELMRQAIAAVVGQSKQEIPHYYMQQDMCLDVAEQWLSKYNEPLAISERVLINAVIYCAIAKALIKFPEFNGFYINNQFQAQNEVHLGNVIHLRKGGLLVPAISDAHLLNPAQMMNKIKDQVIRAKDGGLRMSEMQKATVTVSNLGEQGVDSMQSIIFPPQVAILGIGRVRTSPWVINSEVVSANIVTFTLAADHRVSDGHIGARLLNKINKLLQKPEALS